LKNIYAYPSTPKKGRVIFRFTTDSLNVSQFSDFSSVASIGAAVFGEDAEAALSKLESVRLISSESDLIGKVYGRDGQLLIGGFEVEEGRDKIIVTHEEIDPIEVELAREVPGVSGQQLVDSLKGLPDSEGNTLTISEKQAITGLIGRIGSNEFDKVVAIEDHESVMGIFGKGTLYINKNFINNPLGLLHETAEGMLALPDGYEHLNVHTFMRGAGKDVRVAYDLLVNKAGAEKVNEMAAEDVDRFMDALDETMKESDLRSMTETEKDLMRYNYSQL